MQAKQEKTKKNEKINDYLMFFDPNSNIRYIFVNTIFSQSKTSKTHFALCALNSDSAFSKHYSIVIVENIKNFKFTKSIETETTSKTNESAFNQ